MHWEFWTVSSIPAEPEEAKEDTKYGTGVVSQWSQQRSCIHTHGIASKWSYISCTDPNISNHLQSLEDT